MKHVFHLTQFRLELLLNQIITLVNELKTDMSEHVHGGVTTGAADTATAAAITSPSLLEIPSID